MRSSGTECICTRSRSDRSMGAMPPHRLSSLAVLAAAYGTLAPQAFANKALPDAALIQKLTGIKGTLDEKAGVYKVSAPRKDLKVNAGGVHITPPMGLTSWAAF